MNNRKKEDGDAKTERVTVLFTVEEHENLKSHVWKMKTNKSEYLRQLFLDRMILLDSGQQTLVSFEKKIEELE